MNKNYEKVLADIWQSIFNEDIKCPDLDDFYQYYVCNKDLMPIEVQDYETKERLACTLRESQSKFISQQRLYDRWEKDEFMNESKSINNLTDLLNSYKLINYKLAPQNIESSEVVNSTHIHNASEILNSSYIYSSSKILFSTNLTECEYMAGSIGSLYCNFGARVFDSNKITDSFEISWSSTVSRSFFIHNAFNLKDCMFCSHITSKQYCIANMQYNKEDYMEIQKMIFGNWKDLRYMFIQNSN